MKSGDRHDSAGGPPPLDDGWWAAVLHDEPAGQPARENGHRANGGRPAAETSADWQAARQLYEADEPVELEVVGFNRGGLLVSFHSLRGFVPASHLVNFPTELSEDERKEALACRVSHRLKLKVIEYDPAKGRVVFSQRAAQAGPGSRRQVLDRLHPGDRVRGIVTNLCDFGVFVDLGGVEGLIHVSEVSWRRVAHPRDVLNCDQEVEVSVLSVDAEGGRVGLSLKRLRPDPWATVEQRYQVGQIIEGTVTNVVNFGAFVCVEDGLEGLIHTSELGDGSTEPALPRALLCEGERVRARVVSIDGAGRRLGLSLRQAEQV
jgi:small subunit ribosomal protein S1